MITPHSLVLAGMASLLAVAAHAQDGFSDDFDRPDGTDLGEGWTERVGDWEINNNLLRPVQTGAPLERLVSYDGVTIDRAFEFDGEIRWSSRNHWNGVAFQVQDEDNYYLFRARADNGSLQAMKRADGAFDPLYTNRSDLPVLDDSVFYRLTVKSDGRGTFWWSISDGEETLANGSFFDEDPFENGSAGFYSVHDTIEVDSFRIETFDLETEAPDMQVHTAVEVEFDTRPGIHYLIESSRDLEDWTVAGDPITGDGDNVSLMFSTRGQDRHFFRVLNPTAAD